VAFTRQLMSMLRKVLILVTATAVILPTASASSNSLIPYSEKDGKNGRSLIRSWGCKSKVDVKCTDVASGLPCQQTLKVTRSDCANANNKIKKSVLITWKYCNTGKSTQDTYSDKTVAIYKQWTKPDVYKNEPIAPGKCVELTSKKNINICKRGAKMSMKYEGHIKDKMGDTYCYNYKFLRVVKEWLPEGPCSLTTDIQCILKKGEDNEEEEKDCSGNIIKTDKGNCRNIPVTWKYNSCLSNYKQGQTFKFYPNKSYTRIKSQDVVGLDMTDIPSGEQICKSFEVDYDIDSCHEKTGSTLQVKGRWTYSGGEADCISQKILKVYAATQCEYNFIITEIIDPSDNPQRGYIEIYTPNCAGQVITDDIYIVIYKRGKNNMNRENPTSLKGLVVPDSGFIVFCATGDGKFFYKKKCDHKTGVGSPATSNGRDQIAIVKALEGNLDGEMEVLDIFGVIGEDGLGDNGQKTDHYFGDSRAVRKEGVTTPSSTWNVNDWDIKKTAKSSDADPKRWHDIGPPTNQPIDATPIDPPTKAPIMSPIKTPTSNEKNPGPTKDPSSTRESPSPSKESASKKTQSPNKSPSKQTQSPNKSPSKEGPSPSKEGPSPSKEGPSPSKEGPSPSKEAPSPSKEAPSPSKSGSKCAGKGCGKGKNSPTVSPAPSPSKTPKVTTKKKPEERGPRTYNQQRYRDNV